MTSTETTEDSVAVSGEQKSPKPLHVAGGQQVPSQLPSEDVVATEVHAVASKSVPKDMVEMAPSHVIGSKVDKPSCIMPTIPEEDDLAEESGEHETKSRASNSGGDEREPAEESAPEGETVGIEETHAPHDPEAIPQKDMQSETVPDMDVEAGDHEAQPKEAMSESEPFVIPDVGVAHRAEIVAELKTLFSVDSTVLESVDTLLHDKALQMQVSELVCGAVEHSAASIVVSLARLGVWCIDEQEEHLAEALLRVADHFGSAEAQHALGGLHAEKGRPQLSSQAFQRAAAQGHPKAALRVAKEASDQVVAFQYMLRAAKADELEAMAAVAAMLASGKGCDVDMQASINWVHKAADAGHALSQYQLSAITADTLPEVSFRWAMKAAQQGLPVAEYQVGRAYLQGRGVAADGSKCMEYLQRSADHGLVDAIFLIGGIYLEGLPALGIAVNFDKALSSFRKAADMNHAESLHVLGALHMVGQAGAESDIHKVVSLWTKAAKLGHSKSQYELGRLYLAGEVVKADEYKGFGLILMAAKAGLPWAAFALGVAYIKGTGVDTNMLSGCHWLEQALLLGHEQAKKVFVSLMQDMQLRTAYLRWKEERKIMQICAPSSRLNIWKLLR